MKYTSATLIAAACLAFTISCGGGGGQSSGPSIAGSVQKGPFVAGAQVVVKGFTSQLAETGGSYTTQTSNDLGGFRLDTPVPGDYLWVVSSGRYFNEVSGAISNGSSTLMAVVPATPGEVGKVGVNVLSTLEVARIVTLVGGGLTFAEARTKAETEILAAFKLQPSALGGMTFTKLNMEADNAGAGVLVAISSILQGTNSEAQLADLLGQLCADFADDGILKKALADRIGAQACLLDSAAIRTNLKGRFAMLGSKAEVPDISSIIRGNRKIPPPEAIVNKVKQPGAAFIDFLEETPNTVIYYQTDDALSTPGPWTTGGQFVPFQSTIQFAPKGGTLVLHAYAQNASDSSERSEVSTVTVSVEVQTTPAPLFDPLAGTYGTALDVTLSSDATGSSIHYTTDGTTPTESSPVYSGAIQVTSGLPVMVKAMSTSPSAEPSAVVTSWYCVDPAYPSMEWPGFTSLSEARQKLVGKWIGHLNSPWADYNGTFEFLADGTFLTQTLSTPSGVFRDTWLPFLYYGYLGNIPTKTWEIKDLSGAGLGTGSLTIDANGWQLDVKYINMSADFNHLKFEAWNREYGPLSYELTRLTP